MEVRQEQVVFVLVAALLGFLAYTGGESSGPRSRRGTRSAEAPPFVHHPAPDVSLVRPTRRAGRGRRRSLFEKPSDTRPLPPLAFVRPPLEPLDGLRPPPVPGPAPRLFGALLRAPAPVTSVPGLFDEVEAPAAEEVESPAAVEPAALEGEEDLVTPEERAARIEGYKRLYDWVWIVELHFGHIVNRDRYRLGERPDEPIEFIELDPATGQQRFPGQPAIAIARDRVQDFGFADTIANRIELRRLEFGDPLAHRELADALAFADWCIEHRLDAPRALEVAAEMYTRAAALAPDDPAPRLGLARCHEAAFRFEDAYRTYLELVDGRFGSHPTVLARLASLETRFRLFGRARAHLEQAISFGRTSWEAHWTFGRFLLDRGEAARAAAVLAVAARYEPDDLELGHVRARIRSDLGAALLAGGGLEEARAWFEKALAADPTDPGGLAGLYAVRYLGLSDDAPGETTDALDAALEEGTGAQVLLASGLAALAGERWAEARSRLLQASQADPFHAFEAWRALSWLAERTGYAEEALRFAEQAVENMPTDVYSLFQRGRLLAARDDFEGARESLTAALDRELDCADALALLARLHLFENRHEAAERYFERALSIDDGPAQWHALRGLNLLEFGRPREAEQSFQQALARNRSHPLARCGLAWCAYALGDSSEAMTLLREFDDERRARPEDDPYRVWARAQIERIRDHEEKRVWSDDFERTELLNGWSVDEAVGPTVRLDGGQVRIEGDFHRAGRARLWRSLPAADFVSFEARIIVERGTNSRVGLFVGKERYRRGEVEIQSEVTLSRHREGGVQVRFVRRGEQDLEHQDIDIVDWPAGEPRVVRIERSGESSDTRIRVFVDGIPVVDDVRVSSFGRTSDELRLGVFAEGEPGRRVEAVADDVELVFRVRS